jgi:SAM-dependent methyltransferase
LAVVASGACAQNGPVTKSDATSVPATPSVRETVAIEGRIKPGVARLWRRFYGDRDPRPFATLLAGYLGPDSRVLEIGAGSGEGLQTSFPLRGTVAEYVGIDPDQRVLENPHLDRGVVAMAEDLPFEDASFDVVFHTMVAEHLADPLAAAGEIARVLRPGGHLLFETVSRYHYPMLAAAVTPHRFHESYVRRFGSGRTSRDVFATRYRFNDRRTIESVLTRVGLEPEIRFHSMPPGYLRFSRLSFMVGVLHERTIERVLPATRSRILVVATKPS